MDASPRKVEHAKAPAASADPAADLARKFYHSPLTITLVDLEQAAAHIHRLLRERDAALASIRASDAANSIGGLVGASAHDLHLATEQRLAEQLVQCRAERDAALRERDELRAATLSKLLLPCPICNGVEGCDHTVPERLKARLAAALAKGAEDMRAAIIDDMEKAIVEIKAKQPWNETPLFLRSSIDRIRTLGARRSRPETEESSVKVENHDV